MTELAERPRSVTDTAPTSLVDLLDRLLGTGVVLAGDVTISLAGVDLVQVRLGADRHRPRGVRAVSEIRALPTRIESDAESVERDLFTLVLTVVELIRQLMERQALRRMEELSDDQVEALGTALMRLDEAMTELRERYGLSEADLNLDLGPLGTLL